MAGADRSLEAVKGILENFFFVLDKSWGKEYHNQRKCVDRDAGAAVRSESCRLVQDSRNAAFMVIPREQAA